jgi:hypothetical protein
VFYVFPLTIPVNTPETAKQKTTLKLTVGKITRVMLEFPAGHVGLTHLHINRGLYQLWPANPDASFKSSNETIIWQEDYDLESPAEFEAYAWNEDDTYEHTITVRLELTPSAETLNLWEEIKKLLGGQL